jgi:hypothetical protein
MTGDLRQASYGSQRAGMLKFRREIGATQNHAMIFQFCRPVWQRWLSDAVLAGAVPIAPAVYTASERIWRAAKYIPPKWDWIDPLKDLQAELLAVQAGFKPRADVIEALGNDPEETDRRIAADRAREGTRPRLRRRPVRRGADQGRAGNSAEPARSTAKWRMKSTACCAPSPATPGSSIRARPTSWRPCCCSATRPGRAPSPIAQRQPIGRHRSTSAATSRCCASSGRSCRAAKPSPMSRSRRR